MAADPYKYFRVEARELVERLGTSVLELEREGNRSDVVARALRFAHTLKGAARVVKQQEIGRLAHEFEDLLAPFRDQPGPLSREALEGMLARLDEIALRVRGLTPPEDHTAHPAADEPFRSLRTDVGEMDALLGGIAETQTRVGTLRRTVESVAQARRLAVLVAEHAAAPASREGLKAAAAANDLRVLMIGLERGLAGDAERVDRELREVRSAGERLRLLPVSTLFGPLERTVRDAARALGKRATFRGDGGDVRLDGHVLGALQPALVQAVRNSLAHGIEMAADRAGAGKSAEGSVVLEVARRGRQVAFVCRDDGRGIDLVAVRQALERKGVLAGGLAQDDLLRLLLEGRVSTSSAVTDVSGRGVGLDVVREAASRLGGQVAIRSREGQGTTVEIVVPVSLSSVEALIVEAAGGQAAIPMDAVSRTMRLGRTDITGSPDGDAIAYDGHLIPFAPLSRFLGPDEDARAPRDVVSAVVFSAHRRSAAIGVDRLLEGTTVLARAVPALAPIDPIVAGVFIDAEGSPRPLLDPERLLDAVRRAERALDRPSSPKVPILVVDDSLTTRMLEQSILESAGYAVELATSGEEALEKAHRQRYGLFLVDVEMPGMNGFELLEHLQSDPDLRRIPSILVTSRHSPEDRRRGE
ncbi:MAG TPA: response regulator, partial [Vicinamibacteria bacterium]|nr:response regulator [Vicinamibacteria bacterium]